MKVLHILPYLRKGGAQRLALDICRELQNRQIEVRIVSFVDENDFKDLTTSLDVKIVPASLQLSIFHKKQFDIDALQKAIEDFAPDVIHTHLFEAEIVSRSCHYPQAKWFSHCHDNMKQFRNFSLKTLFNKDLLTNNFEKRYLTKQYRANGGNTFIAISRDTEKYFQENASRFSIELLHNAIDYNKFYHHKDFGTNHKLRLINIGSYQAKKNQQFLIEVAKVLRFRNIDFKLILLGDGDLYKNVARQIEFNKLQNFVAQCGNVNNVEEYLWKSDIYLHSAYYEPLGLVLLEAMSAGLPVVTLDGKGNRDLIEEGKNGYMIYEQNAELFADKILEIWNDKQKYQAMSQYAQEYAKRFDIVPYVDRLLKFYKSEK